jgi:hypothetical protein
MAILRAGPFASSSDSFLDEPVTPSVSIVPVNCANDTSSSAWPWKYNDDVIKILETHTGCETSGGGENVPTTSTSNTTTVSTETATGDFSITSSASSNLITTMTTTLSFYYQAAQSFQIKVTYNGLATGDTTLYQPDFMGFIDIQSASGPIEGFPSLTGSVTRTLPASVKPALYYAQLDTASGIDFPEDVCSPKSSIADTSATLSIEFL